MIGRYQKPSRLQNGLGLLVALILAGVGLTDAAPANQSSNEGGEPRSTSKSEVESGNKRPASTSPAIKQQQLKDEAGKQAAGRIRFTDITDESGLDGFESLKKSGAQGAVGSGCGFIDFDGDGDLDVILLNVKVPAGDEETEKTGNDSVSSVRLLENNGQGRFEDVTPDNPCWRGIDAMGIAVGDFDNDGRSDLFLAADGLNRLLRNLGAGEFDDITLEAGVAGDVNVLSTGCGWVDIDRDGDLDLFVASHTSHKKSRSASPKLYLNRGNGKFEDVTSSIGLAVANSGASLGVTFADMNRDGWMDIYVANDGVPNWLFQNQNGRKFDNIALRMGVAVTADGRAASSTGVDFGLLEDGSSSLFVGSGSFEPPNVYVGANGMLVDRSVSMGLARQTPGASAFATGWIDADLDGTQDLFVVNGFRDEVQLDSDTGASVFIRPQKNEKELLRVELNVSVNSSGESTTPPFNGRGAAFGDIDGDGDVDVLISTIDSPRLLRNENPAKNHWLRLRLVGKYSSRDAIGSRVTIEVEAGEKQSRQVMPTRGYLSQSELAVTFGLGQSDLVRRVTIDWADGSQSALSNVAVDQTLIVEQREVFRPLIGVVPDIEVRTRIQEGDLPGDLESVDENPAGKGVIQKVVRERPAVAQVDLLDRPQGTLRAIRFEGQELGIGDKGFGRLGEAIRKWATAPGRAPLAEREIEIRVNSGLKHEYVARAISVCSGRTNPESGKTERFVNRIRFSAVKPVDSLTLSVGFVRLKNGKRLSDDPIILWEGEAVSIDRMRKKSDEWLKAQSASPKAVTVNLEADSDVATKVIQELIEKLQTLGFERFSLQAVDAQRDEARTSQ